MSTPCRIQDRRARNTACPIKPEHFADRTVQNKYSYYLFPEKMRKWSER